MSFDTKYEYNAGDMGLMMVAEDNKWDTKK